MYLCAVFLSACVGSQLVLSSRCLRLMFCTVKVDPLEEWCIMAFHPKIGHLTLPHLNPLHLISPHLQ